MVSIAAVEMDMTELIFVDSRMKVNGHYYCDVLLSQQMLPAIKHVAGDTFVFQQHNAVISSCQGHNETATARNTELHRS